LPDFTNSSTGYVKGSDEDPLKNNPKAKDTTNTTDKKHADKESKKDAEASGKRGKEREGEGRRGKGEREEGRGESGEGRVESGEWRVESGEWRTLASLCYLRHATHDIECLPISLLSISELNFFFFFFFLALFWPVGVGRVVLGAHPNL
jgi:hypothetical protein